VGLESSSMFSLWMHMLLNDLLVAMVVVVMESNTYFQFSPPSVDTSIESFVEPDTMVGSRPPLYSFPRRCSALMI
jgi:hypothetical protein